MPVVISPTEEATARSGVFETQDLGAGVRLHTLRSSRWRTIAITLCFWRPLDGGTSAGAVLPELLERGTRTLPDLTTLTHRLDDLYGASLTSDVIKIGEGQVILFRIEVADPRFLPNAEGLVSEALGVALEVALEPRLEGEGFPEDVFEQEQTNHLHFLRGLVDRRSAHAVHRARALTFAGERFANYEYGTLEGVAALTAKSMAGFHRTLLATGPVDILVTGAFDAERLADEIRERIPVFGARTPTPVTAPVPHPARRPAREVTEVQPGQQTVMVLGLRTNITTPNPKSVALLVLNGLLGGTSHSRLFNVVREREGLVYAISSSVEKLKGVMQIMAAFRPGRYERVRELVTQELASVVAGEFTAAEIDLAKRSLSRGTRQAADSAARTALRFYAGRLAGDGRTIPEALAAIEAVTRDDLVEAAGSLWLDLAYRLEPEAEAAES